MSAHTPGPWTIERGENDFDIVVGNARLCGYIQREADADLIAAAPDLFAALQHLMRYDFGQSEGAQEARAAIAKATGEK